MPRILRHDATTPIPLWLKGLRKKTGLKQRELAEVIGVGYVAVRKWEAGMKVPASRNRRKLNALAIAVGYAPLAPRITKHPNARVIELREGDDRGRKQ